MKQAIIKYILKWLAGVTSEQWAIAFQSVITAAKAFKASPDRKAWVLETLASEGVKGWAANLLTEVAVGYAKKLRLIPA